MTYQCEFRSEPLEHAQKLYDCWPDYYLAMTALLAGGVPGFTASGTPDRYRNMTSALSRRGSAASWWLRKVHGKVLSTLRLAKAALTFDDALEYLLWKIKRHSGLYIEPTPLQKKLPLIFAWPLLWRLYRRGAFR
jgi:hypothetical protein